MARDRIEKATAAWEDSQTRPGVFDLLADSHEEITAMHADFVEACLLDLQLLCDEAWERGEIGTEGQTLPLPFPIRS